MIATKVDIRVGVPGGKELRAYSNEELAAGMDTELELFEKWFRNRGNEPLVRNERSILKTFLAWKLLYEEGQQDPQT
jgi:hypothetical protein